MAYQPYVTPEGRVSNYVPADYPGITPAGVEQYNPTLAARTQFQNIPKSGTFVGTLRAPGGGGYPSFNFDFAAEQAAAYEQLKPFYQKIIEFAQGDVNLAKRILEYTYQSGMREAKTEYASNIRQQNIDFPAERERLMTEQNRRGILEAGFGGTERERLKEGQAIRREAVDRALQNRESQVTSQRGFGLEKEQQGFQKGLFDTERQQRQESSELAQAKYGIKSAEYQAAIGQKMFEEQQKAIELQRKALG